MGIANCHSHSYPDLRNTDCDIGIVTTPKTDTGSRKLHL